jgi:hypothetical protein
MDDNWIHHSGPTVQAQKPNVPKEKAPHGKGFSPKQTWDQNNRKLEK